MKYTINNLDIEVTVLEDTICLTVRDALITPPVFDPVTFLDDIDYNLIYRGYEKINDAT